MFDRKLNLGQSSLRPAFERVFERKFFDDEFILLAKLWMNNWQPDEEMIALAKSLKKKYAVAILSNSEQSYEQKYRPKLEKVFSPILYSHRERMAKPNPAFFELALKRLGLQAQECIMVDDCHENMKPCQELGIHFALFKNLEKLKKDLEMHGVKA